MYPNSNTTIVYHNWSFLPHKVKISPNREHKLCFNIMWPKSWPASRVGCWLVQMSYFDPLWADAAETSLLPTKSWWLQLKGGSCQAILWLTANCSSQHQIKANDNLGSGAQSPHPTQPIPGSRPPTIQLKYNCGSHPPQNHLKSTKNPPKIHPIQAMKIYYGQKMALGAKKTTEQWALTCHLNF